MGSIERLPRETASAHEPLAYERRHRYELGRELCTGLRVLDLCSGSGRGSTLLAKTATAVVGVDHDRALIDLARAAVPGERLSFDVADPVSFPPRWRWRSPAPRSGIR